MKYPTVRELIRQLENHAEHDDLFPLLGTQMDRGLLAELKEIMTYLNVYEKAAHTDAIIKQGMTFQDIAVYDEVGRPINGIVAIAGETILEGQPAAFPVNWPQLMVFRGQGRPCGIASEEIPEGARVWIERPGKVSVKKG